MSVSTAVESYLAHSKIPFDVLEHPHSTNSMQTAHSAHVRPSQLAKAVIVRNRERYMVCVLPASHILVMNWLDRDYEGNYKLASEEELSKLFPDCETGAVPALGQAYGMKVVWDNTLRHSTKIYFEGGDHRHLIEIGHDEFLALMEQSDHATISCSPETIEYYQYTH
jgi:Ala-tRNA(Pro) deacylase